MSCLLRIILVLIGVQLMAGAAIQFIFDLNSVYLTTNEVFWSEFFKELTVRPPLYVMISGMACCFIGICFPRKSR
ncbi:MULTISPECIES: hypothetical protein [Bacillus]|uniref:hypothetical protein n=1 Tax=Bacillus TaxID=1386 RepID=UPI000400F381|nr:MULTISPECIES: hypothetical protein [Bacillus]WFA04322.1 hypothetical protein P3X63_17200 [Bacillus sp. HSf4]